MADNEKILQTLDGEVVFTLSDSGEFRCPECGAGVAGPMTLDLRGVRLTCPACKYRGAADGFAALAWGFMDGCAGWIQVSPEGATDAAIVDGFHRAQGLQSCALAGREFVASTDDSATREWRISIYPPAIGPNRNPVVSVSSDWPTPEELGAALATWLVDNAIAAEAERRAQ